ncbi:MAG: Rv3235 family protein [Nocardiaceae bacterium]|nr:Rv3235 family protein [Nocardiaceae bacterium]
MTPEISTRPAVIRAPALEPEIGNSAPCIPRRSGPRSSPHDGRSGHPASDRVAHDFEITARAFAEGALRTLLEVMDRRRAFAQLRPHLDPAIRESTQTRLTARPPSAGVATLRRVQVQAVGLGAAEAFGTFSRARRVHAIAARVTQNSDGRWSISAFALG